MNDTLAMRITESVKDVAYIANGFRVRERTQFQPPAERSSLDTAVVATQRAAIVKTFETTLRSTVDSTEQEAVAI